MKPMKLLTASLFFAASTAVFAHGPVRQKFDESVMINAPAEKVWSILQNYGDMSWMPAIQSVTVDKANEVGSVRVLTLKQGGTITEELTKYDASKMSYAYKITDMSIAKTISHAGAEEKVPVLPVNNYSATIKVEPQGSGSVVNWKAAYYRAYINNDPPAEMNEEAANKAVEHVLREGLANIKALAEK